MKVISLSSSQNSQDAIMSIRQGKNNYGPIQFELPYLFYSQHLPELQLLQLLSNFLIKIGDHENAEKYLKEFKEKFPDSANIPDLENRLQKLEEKMQKETGEQRVKTKIEIRGFEKNKAFFLYTDDKNIKYEAKKYPSIFSKPVRKADMLKYQFNIAKNFEMPTHWQELLENQKQIHILLRQLDAQAFMSYRLTELERKDDYIIEALKLEYDLKTYIEGKRQFWGSRKAISLKIKDEFRSFLFRKIKDNDIVSEKYSNQVMSEEFREQIKNIDFDSITQKDIEQICNETFTEFELKTWKARYQKTQQLKKHISSAKTTFTRYIKSLEKLVDFSERENLSNEEKTALGWLALFACCRPA